MKEKLHDVAPGNGIDIKGMDKKRSWNAKNKSDTPH